MSKVDFKVEFKPIRQANFATSQRLAEKNAEVCRIINWTCFLISSDGTGEEVGQSVENARRSLEQLRELADQYEERLDYLDEEWNSHNT